MGERAELGKALAQVGLAGLAGAVVVPAGASLVFGALFRSSTMALGIGAGIFALLVVALAAVTTVAPAASRMTGTIGGRVLWGLLVGGVGMGLWVVGSLVALEAGRYIGVSAWQWAPGTFVLFALLAGTLLRRWYLALGSLTVLVVAGLLLLRSLVVPLPSEVDQRLAQEQLERASIMVTDVPGYHPVASQSAVWQLQPDDYDPNEPDPYMYLRAVEDKPVGDCQIEPFDSNYPPVQSCEVDRPGLFYVHGVTGNAYVHSVDGRRLVLTGPKAFDRAVLRDAVLGARPVDPPGSFTATVPGYTATSTGPQLTTFTPDDKSLVPGARFISVGPRMGASPGECTYLNLACEAETPELRYERFTDQHVYARLVGGREISVSGGYGVSRDNLRAAALAARPPTDADLQIMLPPLRPVQERRSVTGELRKLAREIFG